MQEWVEMVKEPVAWERGWVVAIWEGCRGVDAEEEVVSGQSDGVMRGYYGAQSLQRRLTTTSYQRRLGAGLVRGSSKLVTNVWKVIRSYADFPCLLSLYSLFFVVGSIQKNEEMDT